MERRLALPLPVAALERRARNAKSPKDRHDTAFHAWEASVRLAVAARPPSDVSALERPSLGHWVQALSLRDQPLDTAPILEAYGLLTEVGAGRRGQPRSVAPRALFEALAAYRNAVVGHGSARPSAFYEAAARTLLDGLLAVWDAEVFLRHAERLTYVEAVEVDPTGQRRARLLDLTGDVARVIDPGGTTGIGDSVLPTHVTIRERGSHRSLHPWLLVRIDELREQVLFFNGLGRRAGYLDFVSGEILKGAALEEALPGAEAEVFRLFAAERPAESAEQTEDPDPDLFGDYRILGKLGEGGMGVVYLARQESLARLVAVKMLPAHAADDATAVARFQREVASLSRCEHPNVVKIYASGKARGTHYYAMEYVEGADLAEIARALRSSEDFDSAVSTASDRVHASHAELFADLPRVEKRAPSAERRPRDRYRQIAASMADAARGLQHLHEMGIVHRDIKPGNLVVTASDHRVVVMDLGLAAVSGASRSITRDKGQLLGTLRYMPPEQLQRNLLQVDHRADIYSLGATFYELLTERPFLDGDSEARLIEQILREQPLAAAKANVALPKDLATIIDKATEKDARLRYDTAEALAQDIGAHLDGRAIAARPPTLGYLLRLAIRRHAAIVGTVFAALLVLAGLSVGFVLELDRKRRDAVTAREDADRQRGAAQAATRASEAALEAAAVATAEEEVAHMAMQAALAGAKASLARSEGLRLVGASRLSLRDDPSQALLLAIEAANLYPGLSANNALYDALRQHRELLVTDIPLDPGADAELNADGSRVIAHTDRDELIDVTTGNRVPIRIGTELSGLGFASDGESIVAIGADGGGWILDGGTLTKRLRLDAPPPTAGGSAGMEPAKRFRGTRTRAAPWSVAPARTVVARPGLIVARRGLATLLVWDARSGKCLSVVRAEGSRIERYDLSSDGGRIVTQVGSRELMVWDARSGSAVATFPMHPLPISCVAISRDGRMAATGAPDGSVRIWDIETREELRLLSDAVDRPTMVSWSPDGARFLSSSCDGTVRVWDTDRWMLVHELPGDGSPVLHAAWSSDGAQFASGAQSGAVSVWDARSGAVAHSIPGGRTLVSALAWAPRASRLAMVSASTRRLRVWSATAAIELPPTTLPRRVVLDAASGDAGVVVSALPQPTGCNDATVDRTAGVRGMRLPAAKGSIDAAAFSPDGSLVAVLDGGSQAQIFDTSSGRSVATVERATRLVRAIAFSHDGRRYVSGFTDGARVRDVGVDAPVADVYTSDWVNCVALCPLGAQIVTGADDGVVRVWDLSSNSPGSPDRRDKSEAAYTGLRGPVVCVAVSVDGDLVAAGGADGSARLWERSTGECRAVLDHGGAGVTTIAIHPGARLVTTGGGDGRVIAWDLDGVQARVYGALSGGVHALDVSDDGRRVIAASRSGPVTSWDAAAGTQLSRTDVEHVVSVQASGDGVLSLRAFGSNANRIDVRDALRGRSIRTLPCLNDGPYAASLSHDVRLCATTGWDRSTRIWDLRSGQLVQTLRGHSAPATGLWFVRGQSRLLSSSWFDDRVILWDLDTGDELLRIDGSHMHGTARAVGGAGWIVETADGVTLRASETGEVVRDHTGDGRGTSAIAWSDSTSRFAVARVRAEPGGTLPVNRIPVIRVFSATDASWERTFTGHRKHVMLLSFSPDGTRLVSAPFRGRVRVWDVDGGVELLTIGDLSRGVAAPRFSSDGSELRLVVGTDAVMRVPLDLLSAAKARKTRELTAAERERFGLPPVAHSDD